MKYLWKEENLEDYLFFFKYIYPDTIQEFTIGFDEIHMLEHFHSETVMPEYLLWKSHAIEAFSGSVYSSVHTCYERNKVESQREPIANTKEYRDEGRPQKSYRILNQSEIKSKWRK